MRDRLVDRGARIEPGRPSVSPAVRRAPGFLLGAPAREDRGAAAVDRVVGDRREVPDRLVDDLTSDERVGDVEVGGAVVRAAAVDRMRYGPGIPTALAARFPRAAAVERVDVWSRDRARPARRDRGLPPAGTGRCARLEAFAAIRTGRRGRHRASSRSGSDGGAGDASGGSVSYGGGSGVSTSGTSTSSPT